MGRRNFVIVSVFVVSILALSAMLFGQRVIDLDKVWGDMRVLGDGAGDGLGSNIDYGDINGDGYMDIIIAACGADPGGRTDAGAFYVILGSASPPATIDLSSASADINIYGKYASDWLGSGVGSGDINGDGFDDVLMTAGQADSYRGITYVIFGSASPPSIIDLSIESADMTIRGEAIFAQLITVDSGDINGDGFDDVITGARYYSSSRGRAYIIFGSSSPPAYIDLASQPADITVTGANPGDQVGISASSGDINGDGIDDAYIDGPGVDATPGHGAGATYVIYGDTFPSPPYTIDLSTQSADLTVYGTDAGATLLSPNMRGDVNNDGFDDLIVISPGADPGGRTDAGAAYVILGSSSPPAVIDLRTESADMTIYGDNPADGLGYGNTFGDVNGDEYDDVIVSARDADPPGGDRAGETYVIFGNSFQSPPYIIDLDSQSADISVYGDNADDMLAGYTGAASGDVNGDGFDDLIIGAIYGDPGGRTNAGETYVIFGIAEVVKVEIDIKPGSYPNAVNLGSHGLIPVAILSSHDFDATTVDPDTVELAGAGVSVRGKGNKYMAHEEDVNGDGLVDLVVQVATENLDPYSFQDGYAILTGNLLEEFGGTPIEGSDEVTIVPPEPEE